MAPDLRDWRSLVGPRNCFGLSRDEKNQQNKDGQSHASLSCFLADVSLVTPDEGPISWQSCPEWSIRDRALN